ncbi:MAG TPA: hypothetical protein VGI70_06350, partial [Polyangiales bacterium]
PSARTLRGLGLALYEARHYPDSIRYLEQALSDSRRPLTPKQRDEVGATIERAKLFVGHLALRVEPTDANVTINGQPIERDDAGKIVTEAGWLDFEVSAPDYKTMLRRLQINPGDEQSLTVRLEPEKGVAASTSESAPAPTAASVPPPTPAVTAPAPYQRSSALTTWKWLVGAGAVAGLASGGALLIAQKLGAPSYERDCVESTPASANCAGRHTLLGSTLWDGSIIGLGVGAALAAVSVTLFVLDAEPNERSPGLACVAGPAMVTCSGTF